VAQEDEFRKLNEGIYLHTNATDAQKAMIDAWYDPLGVSSAGQTQQDGIANIPFSWSSSGAAADAPFYNDVIRPSCRACHTSRTSPLDFGDPASFNSVVFPGAICDAGYMPQAFVTWRNFWHSVAPRQPTRVEEYLGLAAGTCTGPH
jgi:hypothetical protein